MFFVLAQEDHGFWGGIVQMVMQRVKGFLSTLLADLWALLPEQFTDPLTPVVDVLSMVNSWLPLDFAITCIVSYYAFLALFLAVKLTRKILWPF